MWAGPQMRQIRLTSHNIVAHGLHETFRALTRLPT